MNNNDIQLDGLHLCPVCGKLYFKEKSLYLHIIHAHQDGEYLAHNLRADLYQRWQDRIPKPSQ